MPTEIVLKPRRLTFVILEASDNTTVPDEAKALKNSLCST
jgi:hypothetical protein